MTVLILGPGHFKVIMYSIYISNQSGVTAYVRPSSEKLQYSDSYVQKLKEEILDNSGCWTKECMSYLTIGGFCFIAPQGTLTLPVENAATSLYISVVCVQNPPLVGLVNFPFDPKMYGCISIKLCGGGIVLLPYNPKPVWFPNRSGDILPTDFTVSDAGVGRSVNERLYFGRSLLDLDDGGIPCAVTSSGNCRTWIIPGLGKFSKERGDLLKNTGFELIRAKRGDLVPPNAVMAGVTAAEGSLFVGRVGGSIPCYITTEDGKIQCFVYGFQELETVPNGEVMVLTR